MQKNNNSDKLNTDKIGPLLIKLSIPAIIGMLVMACYNIVDSIFIGQWIGTEGIAALAIIFPIQMIFMAIGQTIGLGSSSIISRKLGKKKIIDALKTFNTGFLVTITFCLFLSFFCFTFISQILIFFGASKTLLPLAEEYFYIIGFSNTAFILAMVFNNIVRSEGNPKIAMLAMLISAIINIILDPIFIKYLNLGMQGAAIATAIAQLSTLIYLFYYFISGKSDLKFKKIYMKYDFKIIKEILSIGSSAFARETAGSLVNLILNHSVYFYGGDIGIAVLGVLFRALSIIFMPLFGLVQGFLPIAGYNYGAFQYHRVKKAKKIASVYSTIFCSLALIFFYSFPEFILKIFNSDPEFLEVGVKAFKLTLLALPIVGFQIVISGLYQALGKPLPAFIVSIMRQILLLIPLVLILPVYLKISGIWLSFPIADILSAGITVIILKYSVKKNIVPKECSIL